MILNGAKRLFARVDRQWGLEVFVENTRRQASAIRRYDRDAHASGKRGEWIEILEIKITDTGARIDQDIVVDQALQKFARRRRYRHCNQAREFA